MRSSWRLLKSAPARVLVRENDLLSIIGSTAFAPGGLLKLVIKHRDGSQHECMLNHSFHESAIAWFKAGSALNLIGKRDGVNNFHFFDTKEATHEFNIIAQTVRH